jgi:phosphatidylglycerol:prolipoprotein diacylglycerol transferase
LSSYLTSLASAIPFFHLDPIDLGPLPLQPFGILVATGVLVGAWLARKQAIRLGLDDDELRGLSAWVLVGGFAGAHVFDVLAYEWDKFVDDPLLIVKVWAGISSYGGFLGGAIGFYLYCRRRALSLGAYGDAIVYGLIPGFTFGRVGCTIVHDHVGRATDLALGIDYPLGFAAQHGYHQPTRMHNLGMYELMYLIPVCLILFWIGRKPRPRGLLVVLAGTLYAPVRFFLDFLRFNDSDPRYLGLTFAQWMSIVVTVAGIYGLAKLARRPAPPFPVVAASGKSRNAGKR